MSEYQDIFQLYRSAADSLLHEFSDRKEDLFKGETLTLFEYRHNLEKLEWLENGLPRLAEALLPAQFTLRVTTVIHDYQVVLLLRDENGRLRGEVELAGEDNIDDNPGVFPETALPNLIALQDWLQESPTGIWLDEFSALVKALAQAGVMVQSELALFLDKRAIERRILAGVERVDRPKLTVYLFSNALVRALSRMPLEALEREYFLPSNRAVWLVFSMHGYLEGDYLLVYGQGGQDRRDMARIGKLPQESRDANIKALNLRRISGIWTEPLRWLTPAVFEVRPAPDGDPESAVLRQLQSIQALLSILYLADQVDTDEDCYRVRFRGLGSKSFWLGRADLQPSAGPINGLYALYEYAYAGFSPDKVEIAQQFLSLMVEDSAGLLRFADEVREATQKTYQERVLIERVSDYFEARHKVQERLRSATEAASSGVIDLSREVSGDIYKMAGIVGAAVVAAVIQPNITLFAVLVAFAIIAIYMGLVLFYHLPTVQRANKLNTQGHKAGIRSFEDVLSVSEVKKYLEDDQLTQAQTLLAQTMRRAMLIYFVFFFGAILGLFVLTLIQLS
jgi:hypothetical protein